MGGSLQRHIQICINILVDEDEVDSENYISFGNSVKYELGVVFGGCLGILGLVEMLMVKLKFIIMKYFNW